jgi:hypothetical protein
VYDILDPKTNPIYDQDNFQFEMMSFGYSTQIYGKEMCFGCMATASVISLCELDPATFIKSKQDLLTTYDDKSLYKKSMLSKFELAVDAVRTHSFYGVCDDLLNLCYYYDVWPNIDKKKLKQFQDNHSVFLKNDPVNSKSIYDKEQLLKMYTNDQIPELVKTLRYYETTKL